MEDRIKEQKVRLKDLSSIISENEIASKELSKKIDTQRRQVSHKRKKLRCLQIQSVINSSEVQRRVEDNSFVLSSKTSQKRMSNPTTSDLNLKAKQVRRNETLNACSIIHGSSSNNTEPALVGMLDTMTSKFKTKELSSKIMTSKPSLVKEIKSVTLNDWCKDFSFSKENKLRSLNVYYSHNVMGKRKYINIRKANNRASFEKVKVPNYIPYKELAEMINSVDIGTVHDVNKLALDSPQYTKVRIVNLLTTYYVWQNFTLPSMSIALTN